MAYVLLQAHVSPEMKVAIRQMALNKGQTISDLTVEVFAAALKAHQVKQARAAAVAGYTGEAPL